MLDGAADKIPRALAVTGRGGEKGTEACEHLTDVPVTRDRGGDKLPQEYRKSTYGVHRGGDKLPAKIAESGAAGLSLRKFEVCVCVCVCVFGGATLSVTCSCKQAWVCVWACELCERSDRPSC